MAWLYWAVSFAREKANELEGVKQTLLHLGRPVTYASLALCAGFAVLGLSELQQQAEFGWLAAGTLVAAAVVDLDRTTRCRREASVDFRMRHMNRVHRCDQGIADAYVGLSCSGVLYAECLVDHLCMPKHPENEFEVASL